MVHIRNLIPPQDLKAWFVEVQKSEEGSTLAGRPELFVGDIIPPEAAFVKDDKWVSVDRNITATTQK